MSQSPAPTVHAIRAYLHQLAPPHLAEGYDNVGLLLGRPSTISTGVLCSLELTEKVLDEAIRLGCNTLVSHHPIWFGKRYKLTDEDWVGRLLLKAAQADLHLLAVHTNLDAIQTGVNHEIANRLGLQQRRLLRPNPTPSQTPSPTPSHGAPTGHGLVGYLPEALPKQAFIDLLKATFGTPMVRYADAPIDQVQRVAVCGGSGSFLLPDAMAAAVDAFVTGDVTHHTFFDAENRLLFCDIGHWESEQYTPVLLQRVLQEEFPNFAVRLSSVSTNPVTYG